MLLVEGKGKTQVRFDQRMFARVKYLDLMTDLYENSFETFFQSLMSARYPDFLDVRTAGKLGDQGADGLLLYQQSLYACYAPQVFDARAVADKFASDFAKADAKRRGEFKAFVFVHNDRRGMHPQLASVLVEASQTYKDIKFSQMGLRHIWREIMQLSKEEVEDLLRCEIPIESATYGIGMEELAPLLSFLNENRRPSATPLQPINEVSEDKLDYNCLDPDSRRQLVEAMKYVPLVERYYTKTTDDTEAEEVASGFTTYYRIVHSEWTDAEDVLWQLEMYVLGNQSQPPQIERCAWTVLAYFFERCYIFEEPPSGWYREEAAKV
jgi:hypothetical protein